jgi:drug/metabolite transporter (DMT)-like permease
MKYYFLLAFTQLLWAGNTVVAHMANGHIGPFSLSLYRWSLVGLLLLPIVYKKFKQQFEIIRNYLPLISLLSFLGIFLYTALSYTSLTYTSVIHASIINATIPVFIVLFEWLFQKEKIFLKTIYGIIGSFVGVIIIVSHGQPWLLWSMPFNIGDLLAICASIVWAIYSILIKKLPKKLSSLVFLMVASFISVPLLFVSYWLETNYIGVPVIFDIQTINFIAYTAIGPAIVAFTCWGVGIKQLGPVTAGYFVNLLPIFSMILAIAFLHESLQLYDVIGTICVLYGMYLSTRKPPELPVMELTTV